MRRDNKENLKKDHQRLKELDHMHVIHENEMMKLRREREISLAEIEHQKNLITIYDKDIFQTQFEIQNLKQNIEQEANAKYAKENEQINHQILDKKNILDHLVAEIHDLKNKEIYLNKQKEEIIVQSDAEIRKFKPDNIEIKPPEDSAAHITNIKLQKQYSSLKFSIKEIQLKIKEAETAEQNSLLGREGLITELNLLNSNIAELNQIPDLSSHNALNLLDELQKNGELVNLSPYDRKLLEIKNGIEECDTKIKNHKKNCILLMTKLSENDSEEMASKKSVEFHQIVQEYNILTTKLNDMIVSRFNDTHCNENTTELARIDDPIHNCFIASYNAKYELESNNISQLHFLRQRFLRDAQDIYQFSYELFKINSQNKKFLNHFNILTRVSAINTSSTFSINDSSQLNNVSNTINPSISANQVDERIILDFKEIIPDKISECAIQ